MTSEALIAVNRRMAAAKMGLTYEQYEANLAANLKWCQSHKAWEDRGLFSSAPSRSDGLAGSCRKARNADRLARKQRERERAADAAETAVVARMADGWWPAPLEPRDDWLEDRAWPTWAVRTVVDQLVLFADDKACVGLDPELWFDDERVVEAKRICWACPIADDCLTAALRRDERAGVWGGFSTDERDRIAGRAAPAWLEAV